MKITSDGLYWRATYADPDGQIRRLQFPKGELSREDAVIEAKRLIAARHRPLRKHSLRISGLADRLDGRTDVRQATIDSLQQSLRVLIEAIGDQTIARVGDGHLPKVEALLASRGLAPTTQSNTIRRIGDAWEWAKRRGLVASNPFRGIKTIAAASEWKYVSEADALGLAAQAPSENYRALVLLCRLAGLRKREAMELRADAIRWDTNPPELTVLSSEMGGSRANSTKRGRIVPLVHEVLTDELRNLGTWNGPLVTDSIQTMYAKLAKMHEAADAADYGKILHTLRKSCEDDWLRDGRYRPVDVCLWLGNSIAVAQKHYLQRSSAKNLDDPKPLGSNGL